MAPPFQDHDTSVTFPGQDGGERLGNSEVRLSGLCYYLLKFGLLFCVTYWGIKP